MVNEGKCGQLVVSLENDTGSLYPHYLNESFWRTNIAVIMMFSNFHDTLKCTNYSQMLSYLFFQTSCEKGIVFLFSRLGHHGSESKFPKDGNWQNQA